MGKATQLFKSLFGIKNRKEKKGSPNSGDSPAVFCHNPATIPPNITAAEAAWLRLAEKEQNKHAIAFAAATAAADAAVAGVRLTGHGRGTPFVNRVYIWAAVKIQSAFRGYLCRKALRAMRGVVKLQALVRGILVRKQANATLHGMEALIRAQSIFRAQKFQGHFHHDYNVPKVKERCNGRRYSSSFDTKMTFYEKPMMVEVDLGWPQSRFHRSNNSVSDSSDDLFCAIHWNNPARLSAPDSRSHYVPGWDLTGDRCQFSAAQSTPSFINGSSRFANSPNGLLTPGLCSTTFPNYMADTQSFRAKLRSQSVPRQKPNIGPKTRQSLLNELMESRTSHSAARMQRSCSQTRAFKNAVMCKLERSGDSGRGREGESFLGRKS